MTIKTALPFGAAASMPTPAAFSLSQWLIIGAGLLLVGSALTMAAPLEFYDTKGYKDGMEKAGRILAFAGAVCVLSGTFKELHSGPKLIAFIVLCGAAGTMVALLAAPSASCVSGCIQRALSRLRKKFRQSQSQQAPNHADRHQEIRSTASGGVNDQDVNEVDPPEGEVGGHQQAAEAAHL